MQNESIIYFAKEWNQDRTSCDHVFDQLARHNTVLWVNSVAARAPKLTSAHDWRRIFSKLSKCLGGLKQVGPSAWVYQPVVIPLPHSVLAQKINRGLLRWSLQRCARKLGMQRPQLWTFLPNVVYVLGQLKESLVVYYCIDAWKEFSFIDGAKMAAIEQELASKADLCFATAHSLADALRPNNPNTFVAPHGVDYQHFARALDPATIPPEDISSLPRPVIGFFGMLHEWIDLDLIAKMARRHPEWSIVLIGKSLVDTTPLRKLSNVYLLGRRPYETLPAYCKSFTVGLIPFKLTELTRHVNPIKLREYLSAGLPVVSTDLPEVRHYAQHCHIAQHSDEFIDLVARAITENTPEQRRLRSAAMQSETWEARVAQLGDRVMQVKAAKTRDVPR